MLKIWTDRGNATITLTDVQFQAETAQEELLDLLNTQLSDEVMELVMDQHLEASVVEGTTSEQNVNMTLKQYIQHLNKQFC